jgi:acetyl-CoA acyltransferase
VFSTDEGPRRDTSLEALAVLKPAFHAKGTVTAGNSSQTSDGAAAVIVMDEALAELGLAPLARFLGYATAGVEPERFGIGPVPAVRKLLARSRFPSIDRPRRAERGLRRAGAGVPARASDRSRPPQRERRRHRAGPSARLHGARLTTTLLYEMRRRHARYGLVTMCVGGGMGAAALFESLG